MSGNIFIKGKPDKRLVQRLLMKGEISEAEIQDYLSTLPDVSDNAEEIKVTLEECRQDRATEG